MRLSHLLSGLAFGAALSLSAFTASAGEEDYPLSYVERPLTLPKFVLAPEGVLVIDRGAESYGTFSAFPGFSGLGAGIAVGAGIELGAAFGITRDLEVNATVAPIRFAPAAGYGEPVIGATYRFVSGSVEVGARLQVAFVHEFVSGALLLPSVPILVHIGKVARLDVEPGLLIAAVGASCLGCTGGGTSFGLQVPVRFALDITEPLHVGANTGLIFGDFTHGNAGHSVDIPLGLFGGFAIGGKRPIVDIDASFGWPTFVTPGGGLNGDRINPGLFQVGVGARGYLYL